MRGKEHLKELIMYICNQCSDPDKLGATKLNKILWFADSIVYRQTGQSITGTRYKKLQFGPVPINMLAVVKELQEENRLIVKEKDYFGMIKKQFISLDESTQTLFSLDELKFVDFLVDHICNNHTANSISNLSHDLVWDAARMGEEIPLSATLAAEEGVLTKSDLAWADSVIEGLEVA